VLPLSFESGRRSTTPVTSQGQENYSPSDVIRSVSPTSSTADDGMLR